MATEDADMASALTRSIRLAQVKVRVQSLRSSYRASPFRSRQETEYIAALEELVRAAGVRL